MVRYAVLCILPGSNKSLLYQFFFLLFKRLPPNNINQLSQNSVFGDWRSAQIRFHVDHSSAFLRVNVPILQITFVSFFLIVMTIVYPQTSLFLRRVASWRKWSFYMSLVMLLYSCTLIWPYMPFVFLAISGAYSIRWQAVRISAFFKHWWWSSYLLSN